MYTPTEAQLAAEKTLEAQGFEFINWIDAWDGDETHGTMVLKKRGGPRWLHEYREIDPDGTVG